MKALWTAGLGVALGLMAGSAWAQEWQGVPKLTRPIPLGSDPGAAEVRPARFNVGQPRPAVSAVRAQAPDEKGPTLSQVTPGIPSPRPLTVEPLGEPGLKPVRPETPAVEVAPPPRSSIVPMPGSAPVWGNAPVAQDAVVGVPVPGTLSSGDCGDCGTGGICADACGKRHRWLRGMDGCFDRCFGCFDGCFSAWSDPCGGCCPDRGRAFVSAEYLLWYMRAQAMPPLVTASPFGTPRQATGVLGLSTTQTVLDGFENEPMSGLRVSGAYWFPRCNNLAIDASGFYLGKRTGRFTAGSNGAPQFSRPLVDAITGNEIAEIVSFPGDDLLGTVAGRVDVSSYSSLWGTDINLRKQIACGSNFWIDGLFGYRHLYLSEGLDIGENLNVFDPTGAFLGNIVVHDSFHTTNRFNGAQFGLASQWRFRPRWTLDTSLKVALGNVHQIVNVQGSTSFNDFPEPGVNGTRVGGVLASGTNIGTRVVDRFAVLPEVGVKVGLDVTDHLNLFVGYNFLYLSSVVRPGDQIDRVVNRSQFPTVLSTTNPPLVGPARPAPIFRTTDFWAQGVSFGMNYHW